MKYLVNKKNKKIFNGIIPRYKKSLITCYPGTSITGQSPAIKFPLQQISTIIGNQLTLSSGSIKIGQNVHHVLVSAKCTDSSDSRSSRTLYIYKNDEIVCRSLLSIANQFQCSLALSPYLIPVTEGDLISIYVEGIGVSFSGSKDLTYLTVDVVD